MSGNGRKEKSVGISKDKGVLNCNGNEKDSVKKVVGWAV